MRVRTFVAAAPSLAVLLLALAPGCHIIFGLDKATISDGGTGGTGGTGGAGGAPQECIPHIATAPVDDSCGVFVSAAGSDTNDGTKAAPFATLAKAVTVAKGNPVYACTDGLSEALVLNEDATIYGGVDCAQGWKYVGLETRTPWTAGADEVPLLLTTGARAKLENVAITAADALKAGGSSIAVLAQVGSQLTLADCDVSAGNGADGALGDTPAEPVMNGVDGNPGKDACISDAGQLGGDSAVLSCDGTSVSSGGGGNGTTSVGGAGSPGLPFDAASGTGGTGQIDAANLCTAGGDGAAGMTGEAGLGAPMSLGTLGPNGYAGVVGMDAKPGLPGQGAGGGGGGKACANIKVNGNVAAGASGGSGGSGACGGAGGKGGKAGGSSIGIASVGAKLSLDTVNISAKAGGKGGDGGAGQSGGTGGKAGAPGNPNDTSAACAGGKGGSGGTGGKGGGGLGGHSIGIAHTGAAPDVNGATITTAAAGEGGLGEGDTGSGASGIAQQVQVF